MKGFLQSAVGFMVGGAMLAAASPGIAAEKLEAGIAGQASPMVWPFTIAMSKGFFAKRGLEMDVIYTPSASAAIQQLVGGSLDLVASTGINEPLHAAAKGAPVGILRIIGQVSSYAVLAAPSIHSLKDLKGKPIAIGGITDISRLYFDRMLEPNGIKWGDYDPIVIGSTAGRMAGLKSGAVAATMLLPPYSFQAEAQGFNNVGLVVDYAKDLPFSAGALSLSWAAKHQQEARDILAGFDEGLAWFNDPKNRDEAIAISVQALGVTQADAERSYDLLQKIKFFAPDDKISRTALSHVTSGMKAIGDYDDDVDLNKIVIPGITQLSD